MATMWKCSFSLQFDIDFAAMNMKFGMKVDYKHKDKVVPVL
jgi:hypothetical protein